jgi:hypothetical protein
MALARTDYALQSSRLRGGANAAFTTTSYSFPANSLVVVSVNATADNSASVRPTALTLLINTGGLTATARVTTGNPVQWGYGTRVFTFITSGALTTTLTVQSGVDLINDYEIDVCSYTGYDTTTPIGGTATGTDANGTGAASITLSAAPASGDETLAYLTGVVNSGSCTVTAGTGFTNLHYGVDDGWEYFQSATRTGSTSTTVAWGNVGVGGSPLECMLCALVIKAATGGGTTYNDGVTESGSASDSPSVKVTTSGSTTEAMSASSVQDATGGNGVGVLEALTIASAQTAIMTAIAAQSETGTLASAQTVVMSAPVATAESGTIADVVSLGSPAVPTLLWEADSTGNPGWTTRSGSPTFTLAGGETILVYYNGVSNLDQGEVTDSVHGTVTRITAAFVASAGSGTTYGGFAAIANASAGSHTLTPFTVSGGSDGIIRAWKITGMPSTLNVRTAGKVRQVSSSQSITLSTTGSATAGDLAFGGRTNENSVIQNPVTITMPSGWTRDGTDYTDGGTNIPTNVCHQFVGSTGTLTATWTCDDTHITDTSAVLLVLVPSTPSGGNTYSVSGSDSGSASDTPSASKVSPGTVAETAAAADSSSVVMTSPVAVAEIGAIASAESVTSVSGAAITEAGSLVDSSTTAAGTSVSVTESGSASDTSNAAGLYVVAQADSGAAVDTAAAIGIFPVSRTEAGSLLDFSTTGGIASVSTAETMALADTSDAIRTLTTQVSELLNAQDSSSSLGAFVASCVEAGSFNDAAIAIASFFAGVNEAGVIAESVNAGSSYTLAVQELAHLADSSNVGDLVYTLTRVYQFLKEVRVYKFPAEGARVFKFDAETRVFRFASEARLYRFPGA